MRRQINKEGRELVQSFEGLRLEAYLCPAGVPTIGWGHTGPNVTMPMKIDLSKAEAMLAKDLRRFEECVARDCPDATDSQFAAMVSLAYNIGSTAFKRSTVLRMHKAGKHKRAAAAFLMWVFARGKKLRGLVRRRRTEAALYRLPAPLCDCA